MPSPQYGWSSQLIYAILEVLLLPANGIFHKKILPYDSHMKPEHLYYKEVNARDGDYYRRWASAYGECTAELIDQVLRSAKHEEQAYNSCAGILHSCKAIPHGIVEEAARKCMLVSIHTLKES